MKQILNIKLSELSFSGTGKLTASTQGNLINFDLPLEEASNYIYTINDKIDTDKYVCNYVLDGTNWVAFSYKVDGSDAISCRYNKNDDYTEVSIRPALVNIDVTTDTLQLYITSNEDNSKKYALVRFTNNKSVKIIYDISSDEFSMEVI